MNSCKKTTEAVKNFVLYLYSFSWLYHENMNRFSITIIFASGFVFAISINFLSEYFNIKCIDAPDFSPKKFFSPLPDESLQATDEGTLVLHKPDSERDVKSAEASSSEAVGSLHAALEMKKAGKHDKALKLFKHAMALAPKHPDILNHYGEFLEETQKDIVAADQLYFRALAYSPRHSGALANRERTARIVEEIDRGTLRRIDSKRDRLSAIPDSNAAFRRAKKEAYFQHIYHTVGIEGNTMTLSQTRSVVETRMAVAGKSIMEHNEILGLDAALKYINATLVNRLGAITVKDILEIHRRVMGFVDPVESGSFRRTQVYVGGHVPPGPHEIQVLMEEFAQWLNSERAARMHPIRYAALAHYKLVHIHPFTDGNGRTSRLLMNTILMQAGYPPVIILKQDRHKYYRYLEMANYGDIRPFFRFIAESAEQTLDLFLWATSEYATEIPAIEQYHHSRTIIIDDENNDFNNYEED
ncbi:Protein adenylyltransferase Fic [Gryllus bimaculatus]|nr:Protein adenylyltransferase Fic [Gryllus bimaculatus]